MADCKRSYRLSPSQRLVFFYIILTETKSCPSFGPSSITSKHPRA